MTGTVVPVFLDRDGVINANRSDYVRSLEQWRPLPGSIAAMVRLSSAGHPVIVITNQSAVSRGYCTEVDVSEIHDRLTLLVEEAGGLVTGIYHCPHHPDDLCTCRKPATGLIERARADHAMADGGWMVGDAASDIEMGLKAGLTTILVLTGRGSAQLELMRVSGRAEPHFIAADLSEAVDIILG